MFHTRQWQWYRGADKSLARPGRKQARKHVRDARDFNKIKMEAVIKFLFLQGKALTEIHAILTETLTCFLPGRAKDLSAPSYCNITGGCMKLGQTMLPKAPEWCYTCSWSHHNHWSTYISWQIETWGTVKQVHHFNNWISLGDETVHPELVVCKAHVFTVKY